MTLPESLPRYKNLPIAPGLPEHSAWKLFGKDDQLGTLNLLTADRVKRAARLVRRGAVFPLNWRIDTPDPSIMGRGRLTRTQLETRQPVPSSDEYFDGFYPQASTQWDSLKHVGNPRHGFYNGNSVEDVLAPGATRLGIQNFARRGITGRFVLVDVERYFDSLGKKLVQTERVAISGQDLDAALKATGTKLKIGDILLIRFGFVGWYEQLNHEERVSLASVTQFPAPGLSEDESSAEWLWDHHVAAVVCDNPALEATPMHPDQLHYRIIPLLGIAVGEMFDLEALATDCATTKVYEGLFVAAPFNMPGGSGSSGNALAIK